MIVVSHRGPYNFGRDDDGNLVAHRGAGGIVSALGPLLADKTDATWIAAAMSDDDQAAGRAGATGDLDIKLRLLELDREQHRMHYDVVAYGVLWFLHHGMFDRTRRPRFDLRFRDAWDAFVAVNRTFTDAVSDHATAGEIVLVQDYQLTLAAGQLREGFRYVRGRADLLLTMVLIFVVGTFGLNFQITCALLAKQVFHHGAGGYGLLFWVIALLRERNPGADSRPPGGPDRWARAARRAAA